MMPSLQGESYRSEALTGGKYLTIQLEEHSGFISATFLLSRMLE